MRRKKYSAGGVKHAFWFVEFQRTAFLLDQGLTMAEIRQKNKTENLFAASSSARAEMILNTVAARIGQLPRTFLPLFAGGDVQNQKLFCLAACLCSDTLFFDFVYEVIREKIQLGTNEFDDSDLRLFFQEKQRQSETVARWKDCTIRRLGTYYKTMLLEAGLTDRGKTVRRYLRPVIDRDVEDWLRANGLQPVLAALTGVNE